MTRFGRIRRRPDHWTSPHERARARAAERLDGPLGLSEATWLDGHLAECAECAAVAASYEADREALRAMRTTMPEPPRDLWARTAAAIERESAARGRSRPAARDRRIPVGALSGLAVIAVVVGVSTVSGNLLSQGAGTAQDSADAPREMSAASAAPAAGGADGGSAPGGVAQADPTPIAVAAGRVRWVDLDREGSVALNAADVEEVCPADNAAGCALADSDTDRLTLASAPETIIAAPNQEQAVVVSRDAAGAQQLTVVDLPPVDEVVTAASPEPPPSASAEPSAEPSAASTDVPPASEEPPASGEPSSSPTPDVPVSAEPTATAEPLATATPEATLATELAIASDIEIIGEAAAFSPDGAWFAFTARPAGLDTGSNVYLWKVGEDVARPLTTDGESAFASWDGGRVIISRAGSDTSAGEAGSVGSSVAVDPTTGSETASNGTWRPAVDPSGSHAVAWSGTVEAGEDGTWHPAEGQLELVDWPITTDDAAGQPVSDGAIGDFDVRWDETGEWFAVWTADPADPSLGRLSLFRVDPGTGELSSPDGAPAAVPALPGFSIGDGRLAWATPPGQGGEGSRVRIVAWSGEGVGRVETAPGGDLVVIR
jgi:hypothetical protein